MTDDWLTMVLFVSVNTHSSTVMKEKSVSTGCTPTVNVSFTNFYHDLLSVFYEVNISVKLLFTTVQNQNEVTFD